MWKLWAGGIFAVLLVISLFMDSNPADEACDELYGSFYVTTEDGGSTYCENPASGERYLLD